MRPGQEERIEHEYIRRGTLCLITSFHMVTGESLAPTIGPTRTHRRRLPGTLQADSCSAPGFPVADRRGSVQHALVSESCAVGDRHGKDYNSGGRVGRQREVRDSEKSGNSECVSLSPRTTDSIHLRAQAQRMAESG